VVYDAKSFVSRMLRKQVLDAVTAREFVYKDHLCPTKATMSLLGVVLF